MKRQVKQRALWKQGGEMGNIPLCADSMKEERRTVEMTEYRKQCLPSKSEAPRSRVKHTRRPHQSGETKVPVRGWVVAIQHINYADPVYHTLRRARMNVTFDSGLGLLSQDRVHKENPFFICEHESSTEEKRFQFYQGVLTLSLDDGLMDTFWKCIRIPIFLMENNPICFDCYGWMTQWITYLSISPSKMYPAFMH